jgi:hypothetical protein
MERKEGSMLLHECNSTLLSYQEQNIEKSLHAVFFLEDSRSVMNFAKGMLFLKNCHLPFLALLQ